MATTLRYRETPDDAWTLVVISGPEPEAAAGVLVARLQETHEVQLQDSDGDWEAFGIWGN